MAGGKVLPGCASRRARSFGAGERGRRILPLDRMLRIPPIVDACVIWRRFLHGTWLSLVEGVFDPHTAHKPMTSPSIAGEGEHSKMLGLQ